jgi:hypothetical protein
MSLHASTDVNIGAGYSLAVDGYLKIMPVKILHNKGYGITGEIIEGYELVIKTIQDYIEAGDLVIFSNSWGGSGKIDPKLDALFKKADSMGVIIVTASGNNGSGTIGQPSNSEFSESIGAIDQAGKKASFSQYGKGLTFVAPGVLIHSTWPGDQTAILSGTSMATPHVSAVCALVGSYWPDATPDEIKAHIRKYAIDVEPGGYDIFTGFGVPVIADLLDNEPKKGSSPDDPIEDDEPDKDSTDIKKERIITIPFEDLQIVWGIGSFKDQRPLNIDIKLNVTSRKLAEMTYDQTFGISNSFFGRTGIMFSDKNADVLDALAWTGKFFYRYANSKQDNYNISILEIIGTDKYGRQFIRDGKDLILSNDPVNFNDIPMLIQYRE